MIWPFIYTYEESRVELLLYINKEKVTLVYSYV
ncbi:hypothetical protein VPHD148_0094 [Vibrio phage D148]